ncbi:hypothetical protein JB92DRAFT_2838500 [Gautieria morchelliformis]|nr:hypothetical protein JB92DRAFT_2838500 [Gautieria morchelliformis]
MSFITKDFLVAEFLLDVELLSGEEAEAVKEKPNKGYGSDEGESDDPEVILVERKRRKGRDTAPIKLFYTKLVLSDQGDVRYCKVCKELTMLSERLKNTRLLTE